MFARGNLIASVEHFISNDLHFISYASIITRLSIGQHILLYHVYLRYALVSIQCNKTMNGIQLHALNSLALLLLLLPLGAVIKNCTGSQRFYKNNSIILCIINNVICLFPLYSKVIEFYQIIEYCSNNINSRATTIIVTTSNL